MPFLEKTILNATKTDDHLIITLANGTKEKLDRSVFASSLSLMVRQDTYPEPTQEELICMLYQMEYKHPLKNLSSLKKSCLSPLWQCVMHYCVRSLTGKTGGTDQMSRRMLELLWSLYTSRPVDYAGILFEVFMAYVSDSQKPPFRLHSVRYWAMCIEFLHLLHNIQIPSREEDRLYSMDPLPPYTPKPDDIFGPIRSLPEGFLQFADPDNQFLINHLRATATITPYTAEPLIKEKEKDAAKGQQKKKATEISPSKQPKQKKQKKVKKVHIYYSSSLQFFS